MNTSADFEQLSCLAAALSSRLASFLPSPQLTPRDRLPESLPPLLLPATPDIGEKLKAAGWSGDSVEHLSSLFVTAANRLKAHTGDLDDELIENLRLQGGTLEWVQASRLELTRRFRARLQKLEDSALGEVEAARAALISSLQSPPHDDDSEIPSSSSFGDNLSSRTTKFTPQRLSRLNAVFSRQPKLSPAEKTMLSIELGLPERQIACWFANKRNRKVGTGRTQSKGHHHPYFPSSPSRPSTQTERSSIRTVSGSSTASIDSTLSYASSFANSEYFPVCDITNTPLRHTEPFACTPPLYSNSAHVTNEELFPSSRPLDPPTADPASYDHREAVEDWLAAAGFDQSLPVSGTTAVEQELMWMVPALHPGEKSLVFPMPELDLASRTKASCQGS